MRAKPNSSLTDKFCLLMLSSTAEENSNHTLA